MRSCIQVFTRDKSGHVGVSDFLAVSCARSRTCGAAVLTLPSGVPAYPEKSPAWGDGLEGDTARGIPYGVRTMEERHEQNLSNRRPEC